MIGLSDSPNPQASQEPELHSFYRSVPTDRASSSNNLDDSNSVGSSSEMLEQQPQPKRKRSMKCSNRPVKPQGEAPRSANSACRRSGAAPGIKTLRARIGRRTTRIEQPVSIETPVDIEDDDIMDLDYEEELSDGNVSSGRRVRRSTTKEKQNMKEKQAAAIDAFTTSLATGLSIQDLLVDEGVVVRANSLNNWPSVDEMVAKLFVPIMFRALNDEPAHYIVDSRKTAKAKNLTTAQGFHEYGVDGFPVPVVPERWLEHQLQKYRWWCNSSEDCKKVQVLTSIEVLTCQSSPVQGPPM
ncbi:hypothetical protein GGI19_002447 [Coemansia pectinata]|uniref:Uncharacterized protein n=1 Tax=Coemansia pectinata TaxID=1052879 RepID=A0A9W8LAB0_9FUNG|nr:hypothetical protein GGI19_002447 [Coemansia pectinata]